MHQTCDCCSRLCGPDNASDCAIHDHPVSFNFDSGKVFRRVPSDHQRLVQVRLEGQLLRRRDSFLGQAAGSVSLLVLGVIKIWNFLGDGFLKTDQLLCPFLFYFRSFQTSFTEKVHAGFSGIWTRNPSELKSSTLTTCIVFFATQWQCDHIGRFIGLWATF